MRLRLEGGGVKRKKTIASQIQKQEGSWGRLAAKIGVWADLAQGNKRKTLAPKKDDG